MVEQEIRKEGITKSQKRHLKKVAKRKIRKEKRKAKQLREQAESGKLIEENHNGGLYSSEFTVRARDWWMDKLWGITQGNPEPEFWMRSFRSLRPKLQTLLLKWSDSVPRDCSFYMIKELLEIYWSDKGNPEPLMMYAKSQFMELYGLG
jgi:hypothetical protein